MSAKRSSRQSAPSKQTAPSAQPIMKKGPEPNFHSTSKKQETAQSPLPQPRSRLAEAPSNSTIKFTPANHNSRTGQTESGKTAIVNGKINKKPALKKRFAAFKKKISGWRSIFGTKKQIPSKKSNNSKKKNSKKQNATPVTSITKDAEVLAATLTKSTPNQSTPHQKLPDSVSKIITMTQNQGELSKKITQQLSDANSLPNYSNIINPPKYTETNSSPPYLNEPPQYTATNSSQPYLERNKPPNYSNINFSLTPLPNEGSYSKISNPNIYNKVNREMVNTTTNLGLLKSGKQPPLYSNEPIYNTVPLPSQIKNPNPIPSIYSNPNPGLGTQQHIHATINNILPNRQQMAPPPPPRGNFEHQSASSTASTASTASLLPSLAQSEKQSKQNAHRKMVLGAVTSKINTNLAKLKNNLPELSKQQISELRNNVEIPQNMEPYRELIAKTDPRIVSSVLKNNPNPDAYFRNLGTLVNKYGFDTSRLQSSSKEELEKRAQLLGQSVIKDSGYFIPGTNQTNRNRQNNYFFPSPRLNSNDTGILNPKFNVENINYDHFDNPLFNYKNSTEPIYSNIPTTQPTTKPLPPTTRPSPPPTKPRSKPRPSPTRPRSKPRPPQTPPRGIFIKQGYETPANKKKLGAITYIHRKATSKRTHKKLLSKKRERAILERRRKILEQGGLFKGMSLGIFSKINKLLKIYHEDPNKTRIELDRLNKKLDTLDAEIGKLEQKQKQGIATRANTAKYRTAQTQAKAIRKTQKYWTLAQNLLKSDTTTSPSQSQLLQQS